MNNNALNISLEQGEQFKHYQKKIQSGIFTTPNIEAFSNKLEEIEKRQEQVPVNNQKDLEDLKKMQTQFSELMQKYNDLKTFSNNQSEESLSRISSSNPYLRKNIRFTTGEICYVTAKGVAKLYTTIDDFDNTKGKNGCPVEVIPVNIPWINDYSVKGTIIPTTPSLISGTPMKRGQACGNEGKNVYSTRFTDNIDTSYVGCYKNYPQQENAVNLVPVMNSSNKVGNIRVEASSIYQNNNELFGPWRAFDGNQVWRTDAPSFWHSAVNAQNIYNPTTGIYTGTTTTNFIDKMNNQKTIKGETLSVIITDNKTRNIISYTIAPRQEYLNDRRSPNTWHLLGLLNKTWYEIDFKTGQDFSNQPRTFRIFDERNFNGFMIVITKVGNNNATQYRNCVQIATLQFKVVGEISDNLTAMMSTDLKFTPNIFNDCKNYAFHNNYKFFGLQDYDKQSNSAKCVVSNDLSKSMTYGDGLKVPKLKQLWSSNTDNQPGNTAMVSVTGSLSVINSSGQVVFSTPATKALPSNYFGCYGDRPQRAMPKYLGNKKTYETCKSDAEKGNWAYFGLQYVQPDGTSECWVSNDFKQSVGYGRATNCTKAKDGTWRGGGWSNAVYNTSLPQSNYFLFLRGDGEMLLYRGGNHSWDPQELIWNSGTQNKQQEANPEYVASNGKYPRNFLVSGEVLGPGEFVGSTDGKIFLIMEPNGNLVLYTTIMVNEGCLTNRNTFGTSGINAIYQLGELSNKNYLGKFAYIDDDTNLREYKGELLTSSNEYMFFKDYDSHGNDIQRVDNTSREALIELCNKNDKCGGFIYNSQQKYGFLKDKNIFPKGSSKYIPNSGLVLGIKKDTLKNDNTCAKITNDITAFQIEKYPVGENISSPSQCYTPFLPQETIVTLDKYRNELIILSKDIANKMKNLYNTNTNIHNQLGMTQDEYSKNIDMYDNIDKKIRNDTQNLEITKYNIEGMQNLSINDIDGMLTDTDLRVLQENYSYFLWTILAVGSVAATINMMKK
jgi:hypothetical protein